MLSLFFLCPALRMCCGWMSPVAAHRVDQSRWWIVPAGMNWSRQLKGSGNNFSSTRSNWEVQYQLFAGVWTFFSFIIIIIIIYPLTARAVRAPQMILQPVSSVFPCFPLPSGTLRRPPGLPIPWCCLPTTSSVCPVFFPLHCALQDGFGQTWWTGNMSILLQFASLYGGQEVFMWFDCLLDLDTDFLVRNMVFV